MDIKGFFEPHPSSMGRLSGSEEQQKIASGIAVEIAKDDDGREFKILLSEEKFETHTMTEKSTGNRWYALVITEEIEQLIANEHYEY